MDIVTLTAEQKGKQNNAAKAILNPKTNVRVIYVNNFKNIDYTVPPPGTKEGKVQFNKLKNEFNEE